MDGLTDIYQQSLIPHDRIVASSYTPFHAPKEVPGWSGSAYGLP